MTIKNFVQPLIRDIRGKLSLLKLELDDFKKNPPLLIYSMGKSGTSTVEVSLKEVGIPFYKVHNLSSSGIKGSENSSLRFKNKKVPKITQAGKIIRHKIEKNGGTEGINWKIITLTREPIAHAVSNLFQSLENRRPDLIDEDGEVKIEAATTHLHNRLTDGREQSLTWFDRELKATFDIDVYDYPYNHRDGFLIIRDRNIEVLVIRAEDLSFSLPRAIKEFLGVDIEIKLANIGNKKKFSSAYNQVRKTIKFPQNVCENIFQTKYFSHFYTEAEKEQLSKKWSQREQVIS